MDAKGAARWGIPAATAPIERSVTLTEYLPPWLDDERSGQHAPCPQRYSGSAAREHGMTGWMVWYGFWAVVWLVIACAVVWRLRNRPTKKPEETE